MSTLYSDQSVLEYHHLATAFTLALSDNDKNIFSSLRPDRYRELRKLVVNMVLSTDMAKHFEYINKFKARIDGGGVRLEEPAVRGVVLEVAMKCADLNNPSRDAPTAQKWTEAIMAEFYSQGDMGRCLYVVWRHNFARARTGVARFKIYGSTGPECGKVSNWIH